MVLHNGLQKGTCSLISHNLAIIPSHCIEDLKVTELKAIFGYIKQGNSVAKGTSYGVQTVVEYDPKLDYAIIQLEKTPGKDFGLLNVTKSSLPDSEIVLLHHPLQKTLKVSIHTFMQMDYQSALLSTYHDSDYGSSGGAYISPSKIFVAMHLGIERQSITLSACRLAIPIGEIIEKKPKGILAQFANKQLQQNETHNIIGNPTSFLLYFPRNYIDLEIFKHQNYLHDNSYLLREKDNNLPGVIIESHQAKHLPGWKGGNKGGKGSTFKLVIDDFIILAENLIENCKLLNDFKPSNPTPKKIVWDIPKKKLPHELSKKLKGTDKIGIYAAFNWESQYWEIHFFPDS